MQTAEERSLALQSARVKAAERDTVLAMAIGAMLTLLICGGVGLAINRLIVRPLVALAAVMRRLVGRDLAVTVPNTRHRNEVGEMARAVEVFKGSLIELSRTSVLRATADTLPAMVGYVDRARRSGFLNGEFERWFDLKTADADEVQGRPLRDVFAADAFPGAARELDAALAGTDTRFVQRLSRRDGERRDVEAFYRPHRGPDC